MTELYALKRAAACLVLLILPSCLLFSQPARTQTAHPSDSIAHFVTGYYISLPAHYDTSNKKYPLIVFLIGQGEVGDGSPQRLQAVLKWGTPMQINQQINGVNANFPDPVTVGGKSWEFVVITPQWRVWPDPDPEQAVNEVIDYTIANYKIDTTKMYLTGLSMGGALAWDYAGYSAQPFARRLAGIVPVAGVSAPLQSRIDQMVKAHLPVWATHDSGDSYVPAAYTEGYVKGMIAEGATPTPLMTIFNTSGHGGWIPTYGAPNIRGITDSAGLNVYQWMVQYKREGDSVVLDTPSEPAPPVPPTPPTPPTPPPPPAPPPTPPSPPPPPTPPAPPPPPPPTPPAPPPTQFIWGSFSTVVIGPTSVLLSWSSLKEENNKFFVIQRGSDSLALSNLDTVAAADSPYNYAYIDSTAPPGTSYYRVYQSDVSGNTTFSGTRKAVIPPALAAAAASPAPYRLTLRPNPTPGIIILEMTSSVIGKLDVILFDAAGGVLRKWKLTKENRHWSQTIDPGYLPPGTYYLTVSGPGYREVKPFLRIQE